MARRNAAARAGANAAVAAAIAAETERLTCSLSFPYWCNRWAQVYDASSRTWLPFRLWPSQIEVAQTLQIKRLMVMLKARQLGMSWLATAYGLWLMLFRPAATTTAAWRGAWLRPRHGTAR